jgi:8-oxo-dGTP pyrophosphatase MutT (NUDIX family)
MKKNTVAIFVLRGDEILLGWVKRGFGQGRYDGFGGKIEPEETAIQAARRELQEESGVIARGLEEVATTFFDYQTVPDQIYNTVFVCRDFLGEPVETNEMQPRWFKLNALPYDLMWADEKIWLPLALAGKKFDAAFHYKDFSEILEYKITPRNG